VQIEGTAKSKGVVTSKENQEIRNNYRKYHNLSYERYCHLPQQVFIEIQPIRITNMLIQNPAGTFCILLNTRQYGSIIVYKIVSKKQNQFQLTDGERN